MAPHMTTRSRFHPLRPLFTGMLALLPLAATLALLAWATRLAAEWLGPGSAIGAILTYLGLGVASSSPVAAYVIGLIIVLVGVYGVGLLVETGLQRGIDRLLQATMRRIPVVRTIYDVAQRLVGLIGKPKDEGMNSMSPVWLFFGGPPAPGQDGPTAVLGLRTTHEPVLMGGAPYHGVLVPTAPVPIGGGLLFVPAHWVQPADVGIEGVTSIYVSMGVTAGQYLRPHRPAPPAPNAARPG